MSEWRTLGPEEVIQEGDEIASRDANNWFKCCTSIAGTVKDNSFDGAFQFRRRVSPVKESLTTPVWEKFHTMWGDASGGRQYCKKEWMELQALIQNLEQRAEKAEDGLDLIYSASGQEHGTPDTVVAGIRHMRLKIDEFIAARQQAEKERDEARRSFADYIERTDLALDAIGVLNRDGVGRIGPYNRTLLLGKERDQLRAENERLRKHLELILPMAKGYAYQNPVGNNLQMVMDAQQALAAKGERTERCGVCGNQTPDWVDVDARGRICRACEAKGETK